jgi:hypothetical protein
MKQTAMRTSPWATPQLQPGVTAAIIIRGLFMLALGIWAFFAPVSFAAFVAFPYNGHLLHDVRGSRSASGRRCFSPDRHRPCRDVRASGACATWGRT